VLACAVVWLHKLCHVEIVFIFFGVIESCGKVLSILSSISVQFLCLSVPGVATLSIFDVCYCDVRLLHCSFDKANNEDEDLRNIFRTFDMEGQGRIPTETLLEISENVLGNLISINEVRFPELLVFQ